MTSSLYTRPIRPTWAEIDMRAFRANYFGIRQRIAASSAILSVVKANAYGHGIIPCARESISLGARILGVATIEEGIALRHARISAPVLVMGSIYPLYNFEVLIAHKLTPIISSLLAAQSLNRIARAKNIRVPVHIKIDTGMGRIGISAEKTLNALRIIAGMKNIRIDGIMTHLASAPSDREFTNRQIGIFGDIVRRLQNSGTDIPYAHIANSAAVIEYPGSHFSMVRPGIILYGLSPYEHKKALSGLYPILKWRTCIVYIKRVRRGTSVSYGRTWKAKKPTLIGTIPVGYADGYPRALSNTGEVLVRGARCPIAGRVCMDMTMIDLTRAGKVRLGDEVVLIGTQGSQRISAEEVARLAGTINYAVTCGITDRVPRIYRGIL